MHAKVFRNPCVIVIVAAFSPAFKSLSAFLTSFPGFSSCSLPAFPSSLCPQVWSLCSDSWRRYSQGHSRVFLSWALLPQYLPSRAESHSLQPRARLVQTEHLTLVYQTLLSIYECFPVLQLGYILMDILRIIRGTWQFGKFAFISSTVIVRRVLIFSHTIIMGNLNTNGSIMKNIQATENKGLSLKLLSSINWRHLLSAVALVEMPVEEWLSHPRQTFPAGTGRLPAREEVISTEVLRPFLPLGYVFTPLQHVKQSP